MNNRNLIFALLFLTLGIFCSVSRANPNNSQLFQVSTFSSLLSGIYDGDINYSEIKKNGNFGVGTFNSIDGEMTAVDNKFYRSDNEGKLSSVKNKTFSPFAEVIKFKPSQSFDINDIENYQNLSQMIESHLPNSNIPYAIRIDGTFKSVLARSLIKQAKPYKPLKADEMQSQYTLINSKGTLVGFWFPKEWGNIGVPGAHFHFISADKTRGGHVIDLNLIKGTVKIQPIYQLNINLQKSVAMNK